MRVSDIAKELNTTPEAVLAKLRSLKLKAKDSEQELNAAVASVVKSELSKDKSLPRPKEAPKPEPKAVVEKPKVKEKEKEKEVKAAKPAAKEPKPTKAKPKAEEKEKKTTARGKKTVTVSEPKEKKPAKAKEEPKPIPVKIEAPPSPKVQAPPPKEIPPVTVAPVKPKARISDEPFVSVKPLPKRKKKPMGGSYREGGRDQRGPESDRLSSDMLSSSTTTSGTETTPAKPSLITLEMPLPISVKDLAVRLQEKPSVILKRLMQLGVFANINQYLDEPSVQSIAAGLGYHVSRTKSQEEQLVEDNKVEEDPKLLKPRAPVVTFMGHVDHGKTSLLDKIKKSKIADQEHGGITQHIGAYSVNLAKGMITFLDTPGHEAFTAMRARGANITDIVVLVVAADEGMMPQTVEALDHARAAKVPIVIAMNKIDKPNADPERVKKQLADRDLLPEDWGGKTIVVGVSALTGAGIDQLLEMILLEAELLELKANYERNATGIVVDAHMSHGKGAMASVIVQNGTLKEGEIVVVGSFFGKIRAMFDHREKPIKEAGPSTATEILGLPGVPEPGDIFYVVENEKQAREITTRRIEQIRTYKQQSVSKITLEDLYSQIKEGIIKELNVIVKADVQGSLEALIDSLKKIPSDEVSLKFIHTGIGEINASDIILADASNAIIIGFHVDTDTRAKQEIDKHPVEVRTYRIIYDAVNDIKNALEGLLEPKTKKKFLSRIDIRQVFKLSRSGIVAGCYVQKGKVHRKANIDILRNGDVVFTGVIGSLKRFKDDVREVGEGMECGITINGFSEIQPGDVIEAYELEKIARKL